MPLQVSDFEPWNADPKLGVGRRAHRSFVALEPGIDEATARSVRRLIQWALEH